MRCVKFKLGKGNYLLRLSVHLLFWKVLEFFATFFKTFWKPFSHSRNCLRKLNRRTRVFLQVSSILTEIRPEGKIFYLMKKKQRLEIMIETHEVTILRFRQSRTTMMFCEM